MTRINMLSGPRIILCAAFALALTSHRTALGQAAATADKATAISAFATADAIHTGYGTNDAGYTVGGDYGFARRGLEPSAEVRFTQSTGSAIRENSFLGGVKADVLFHRYRPYADAMVGYGTIQLPQSTTSYTHDNGLVYALGGGLEYSVSRNVAFKFDGQYQHWTLGTEAKLKPLAAGIGFVYHVPFGFGRH